MKNEIKINTAKKINELHDSLMGQLKRTIETAIEIGQLLTEKKAELKHGEFGQWIQDNLVFTDRTAQRYIKLFENKEKVLQAGNVTEAYKMLGEGKNDTVSDLDKTETVSDFVVLLRLIERDLYVTKLCNKYMDEDWKEGEKFYISSVEYKDLLSDYLDKQKDKFNKMTIPATETDLRIKLNQIDQMENEAAMIQGKLCEIQIWNERLAGQVMAVSSLKKLPGLKNPSVCRELASVSFDMIEEIIKTGNRIIKTI